MSETGEKERHDEAGPQESVWLDRDVYDTWCQVGDELALRSHTQIATVLLNSYLRSEVACRRCGRGLAWLCAHCHSFPGSSSHPQEDGHTMTDQAGSSTRRRRAVRSRGPAEEPRGHLREREKSWPQQRLAAVTDGRRARGERRERWLQLFVDSEEEEVEAEWGEERDQGQGAHKTTTAHLPDSGDMRERLDGAPDGEVAVDRQQRVKTYGHLRKRSPAREQACGERLCMSGDSLTGKAPTPPSAESGVRSVRHRKPSLKALLNSASANCASSSSGNANPETTPYEPPQIKRRGRKPIKSATTVASIRSTARTAGDKKVKVEPQEGEGGRCQDDKAACGDQAYRSAEGDSIRGGRQGQPRGGGAGRKKKKASALLCDVCGRSFSRPSKLKSHRYSHQGFELLCHHCSKKCHSKRSLDYHIQQHHTLHKPFTCDFPDCRGAFATSALLARHRGVHGPKRHTCAVCGRAFSVAATLRNHQRVHDTTRVPSHVCAQCGVAVLSATTLKIHTRMQHPSTGERAKLRCEVCGKEYRYAYDLHNHLKKHGGEKTKACDLCDLKFFSTSDLARHKRYKHPATPRQRVPCPQCDKTFTDRPNLLRHVRIQHNKERRLQCDACGYSCLFMADLSRHKLIHSQVKPFLCTVCGKGFRRNFHLKQHCLTHSNLKPPQQQRAQKVQAATALGGVARSSLQLPPLLSGSQAVQGCQAPERDTPQERVPESLLPSPGNSTVVCIQGLTMRLL